MHPWRTKPNVMKLIPQEIMVDIFVRLPAKCVGRSRCVSKLWQRLLSEPCFIKSHIDRTKKVADNELIILISSTHKYSLYRTSISRQSLGEITALATDLNIFVDPDYYTEGMASCDGLIIIEDDKNKRLIVNPTTKETRELLISPYAIDPRASFTMYGLGYDHVSDDYKVVTLSYYNSDNEYEPDCTEMFVNVYSLRNDTWKQAESSPYDHAVGHVTNGVFVNGSIHWITSKTSHYSSVIVGFDLVEEKFHEIPAPSSIDGTHFVLNRLGVLGGCLCLSPSSCLKKETDIWVMKEYGAKQSWTKFSIVDDKVSEFRPLFYMSGLREVAMVRDEDTISEKLVMYNCDTAMFEDITIHSDNDNELRFGGRFLETLVSPYYNRET